MRTTLFSRFLFILHGAAGFNLGPDYNNPIEGTTKPTLDLVSRTNLSNPDLDLDVDLPFSQPVTFAHLEWQRCLSASHHKACSNDIWHTVQPPPPSNPKLTPGDGPSSR